MYTPPWIPRRDSVFGVFAAALCRGLDKDPARYAMAPAETQALMQLLNRFQDALLVATTPATRTSGTIAAKQDARSMLQRLMQQYAAFIRPNDGIVDQDKIDIGIRPRNVSHRPRKCPTTAPLLKFLGSIPGIDELFYTDSNTPASRAKPFGAAQLELWIAYSLLGEPVPKIAEARYFASFKKNPIQVVIDLAEDARGARPTYHARWQGHDGQVGPWSLPMSLAIARAAADKAKREAAAEKAKREAAADVAGAVPAMPVHARAA